MGAGEYVSVRAQRELFEQQIAMEKEELEMSPKEEEEELALIYQAKGIPDDQARALARRITANAKTAIEHPPRGARPSAACACSSSACSPRRLRTASAGCLAYRWSLSGCRNSHRNLPA